MHGEPRHVSACSAAVFTALAIVVLAAALVIVLAPTRRAEA
jgi:hypothetical protein